MIGCPPGFFGRGTPPRARGRVGWLLGVARNPGNTPACAGKGKNRRCCRPCAREHPRVRGEGRTGRRRHRWSAGTPPRARGRVRPHRFSAAALGNTPACAGKGRGSLRHRRPHREHPRVRGEGQSGKLSSHSMMGTPPRARGRVPLMVKKTDKNGNTPACAGKGRSTHAGRECEWEHPRVRGEGLRRYGSCERLPGTPPRARGRALVGFGFELFTGNTPACAGKGNRHGRVGDFGWEHPRVRGEGRLSPV